MNLKTKPKKDTLPDFRKSSKLKYPEMVPLKLLLKLNPIQIALFYTPSKNDTKKRLYSVDLQDLLSLGNAERITKLIFAQHEAYFDESLVPFEQVFHIIDKILEIIQNEILKDEEGEGGESEEGLSN